MTLARQIRLRTLLLLILILAVMLELYLVKRRQAQTLAALAFYRQPLQEGIYDALDQPLALTYADGAALEDVLKELKRRTTGKKLPSGVPIYVDPIGLQEANVTMASPVKRPVQAIQRTVGEHLRRVLGPLALTYEVKDGFLMITSTESQDGPIGGGDDPYVKFRDVLR
jgi:hypothetical protein